RTRASPAARKRSSSGVRSCPPGGRAHRRTAPRRHCSWRRICPRTQRGRSSPSTAATSPGKNMSEPGYTPPDLSLFGEEHIRRYLETDGEVGYEWNGVPTLVLFTTGRKSGEQRRSA